MTRVLVDSDWVADFLNGRSSAVELLTTAADSGVAISIITYAELFEGVAKLDDADRRRAQLDQFTETVDVIGFDIDTARVFAGIRADLRTKGQLIPDMDSDRVHGHPTQHAASHTRPTLRSD